MTYEEYQTLREAAASRPPRYTVAENRGGYELHSGVLRWCVVDNRPQYLSTYSPIERGRILTPASTPAALVNLAPFRQIAFCIHKEDADLVAAALNMEWPT